MEWSGRLRSKLDLYKYTVGWSDSHQFVHIRALKLLSPLQFLVPPADRRYSSTMGAAAASRHDGRFTETVLVRHGETDCNLSNSHHSGTTDRSGPLLGNSGKLVALETSSRMKFVK
jgi:hypothetical protein